LLYIQFEVLETIETMNTSEFSHRLVTARNFLQEQALKFTSDRAYAEDLVQDTLLKAVRNRNKFEDWHENSLESWLYVILKNTFLSAYRKQKRRQDKLAVLSDLEGFLPSRRLGVNQASSLLIAEEIDRAFKAIKDEYRTTFMLYHKGFKYSEIAGILSLPLGTVKSHIHEARKALQKELKDFADKEVDSAA
jgi:RNA polymerase sigma-70 factor (ECF subfamily)